jgi:hypothetical protein
VCIEILALKQLSKKQKRKISSLGVFTKGGRKRARWLSNWPCSLFHGTFHMGRKRGQGTGEKNREPNPGRFLEK